MPPPEPFPETVPALATDASGSPPDTDGLVIDLAAERLRRVDDDELWTRREAAGVRDELVARFLPLARRLASRYRNANEPFDDLAQVASIGLLSAIDRFDPDRGATFQSFAIPTILGELKRHFRDTGWAVHVPRGAKEMAVRVNQATRELTDRTGRAPRLETLAEHLGAPPEEVLRGLHAGQAHYSTSLDAPAPGADPRESQSLVESLGADDERIGLTEVALSLRATIPQLSRLERRALGLRIIGDLTQTEIASQMGCSQMQVSRLLRRAAARMQAASAGQPG